MGRKSSAVPPTLPRKKNAAAQSSLTRKTCAANGQKAFTRLLRSDRRGCLPPARTHRRLSWGKRAAALSITAFLAFDFIRFARDCQAEQGRLSVKGSLRAVPSTIAKSDFGENGIFRPFQGCAPGFWGLYPHRKPGAVFAAPGPPGLMDTVFFRLRTARRGRSPPRGRRRPAPCSACRGCRT